MRISKTPSIDDQVVHFVTQACSIILIGFFAYLIRCDYDAFKALGPGGTPYSFRGYLQIRFLGLFVLSDPYHVDEVSEHFHLHKPFLKALPYRQGPRPVVRGVAPHRQKDQRSSPEVLAALRHALRTLANGQKDQLIVGKSCFEKHGIGLFCLKPVIQTCRGEVCHVHSCDGSLHLVLHPKDIKMVLVRGWGERHPLARGGWFQRFVPKEFTLIYAPRNLRELETTLEIVAAATWWVGGGILSPT